MSQTEQVGNVKITLDGRTVTMINVNSSDSYTETLRTAKQAADAFNKIITAARKVVGK
jgi:hypothetical protein